MGLRFWTCPRKSSQDLGCNGWDNEITLQLVGGFNPSEKYEFVTGKDDAIYCGK